MNKVKITVLKTTLDEELAREYGAAGLGPCPMLKAGQVFYADYAKPEGFAGSLGFIGALSHAFCARCNRVRLTADGFLKLCLGLSSPPRHPILTRTYPLYGLWPAPSVLKKIPWISPKKR